MSEPDLLKLTQLLQQTQAGASCGTEHLSTEQALAWIDGELSEAQISECTARVMACAACAQNLRWLLDAARWSDALLTDVHHIVADSTNAGVQSALVAVHHEIKPKAIAVTEVRQRKTVPSRWRTARLTSRVLVAGLAACLVLTLGVWVVRQTADNDRSDRLRTSVGSTVPAHRAVLANVPKLFQWECMDSAPKHFELLDQSGQMLIERATSQCQVSAIASTQKLGPGVYVWQVRDAGYQVVNGPFVFEIR